MHCATQETTLYRVIEAEVKQPRFKTLLNSFHLPPEDAIHDLWIVLIRYARTHQLRSVEAYARHWVPKLIHGMINREIKHRRNRDMREVV